MSFPIGMPFVINGSCGEYRIAAGTSKESSRVPATEYKPNGKTYDVHNAFIVVSEDTQAVLDWFEAQQSEFMTPNVEQWDSETELDDDGEYYPAGWYSRLSASGYLDCTDWNGPYESEWLAVKALYEMFAE